MTYPKDNPLRPFYVHDRPDGSKLHAYSTTILHGVRAALALRDTNDPAKRAPRATRTMHRTSLSRTSGDTDTPPCALAGRTRNRVRVHSAAARAQRNRRRRTSALPRRSSRRTLEGRERPQMRPVTVEGDPGLSSI